MLGLKKKLERRIQKKLEGKTLKELQQVGLILWIAIVLMLFTFASSLLQLMKSLVGELRLEGISAILCSIACIVSLIATLIMFLVDNLLTSIQNKVEKKEENNKNQQLVKEKLSSTFKEVIYWPHAGDEVLMRCAKELKQTTIRHAKIDADGEVEILVLDNTGKVVNSYTIDATSFCLNYKIK